MLMGLGLGCVGLGCMGGLTSDQKTKASAMQSALNNYLMRLRAYKKTSAAADVEDAERILTNGVDKFWSDVNQYGDWDTALNTYRGLTKIAEDAIVVAQNKIPYSRPIPAEFATTAPASQTQVANAVASQAIQEAQAVAQQSAATQASYAPYIAPQYMGMMMAASQAQGAMMQQQAAQKENDEWLGRDPSSRGPKPMNTWLVVGAVAVGLGVLYFAFRKQ